MGDSETWTAFAALATVIIASMAFSAATMRRIMRSEVKADIKELSGQIDKLDGKLSGEIQGLRGEIVGLRGELGGLDRDDSALMSKVMGPEPG